MLARVARSGRLASREGYSTRVGRRVWSWGTLGLVVQFFNIYLTAVTLKFKDKNWRHGIATFK